jgi:hypothetical protein
MLIGGKVLFVAFPGLSPDAGWPHGPTPFVHSRHVVAASATLTEGAVTTINKGVDINNLSGIFRDKRRF